MLCREIIAIFPPEIFKKDVSALWVWNVEFWIVKAGGTYINHWALKDWTNQDT